MLAGNRKPSRFQRRKSTLENERGEGSDSGRPKKLLLVSEPKSQSHPKKGESWLALLSTPPPFSPRDSGLLLQVTGRKGVRELGHHFLPVA